MLKFRVTDDQQWMLLLEAVDEVEKKQVEISLTQKIHNHFFHPLVKKKIWDGSICFIEKRGGFWKVPIGLWRELLDIGEKYKIDINVEGLNEVITDDVKLDEFTQWVNEFFEGGIGGNPKDAFDTIDAGELGYCEAFDFKCAASRTCDAWVIGGPIVD